MPLVKDEGPVGLIICPARELAKQTHEILVGYADAIKSGGGPELRGVLAMGGIDMREQGEAFKRGLHFVVATPGRLKDMLKKKRVNLDICRCGARQRRGRGEGGCRVVFVARRFWGRGKGGDGRGCGGWLAGE